MALTITISLITIVLIILSSVFYQSIKIKHTTINLYWIIALIGALFLIITSRITFKEIIDQAFMRDGMNPIEILTLFISMTIISIFLDEVGFFSFLASWMLSKIKGSQYKIFISFYFLIAILTTFTSNDIIIFTLTPFIIFFSIRAKISPIPYLIAEFSCANTWSMIFLIGNPTNIYLTQCYNISFFEYFLKMSIPTLLTGIVELSILLLLFKNKLKENIEHSETIEQVKEKTLTIIGLVILAITTIMLSISSYVDLPMYIISLISMIVLMIASITYSVIKGRKPVESLNSLKRASWELVPFVLSMFIIVLALDKYEITSKICFLFKDDLLTFKYGFASFISSNLLNNIPMTIMYSKILSSLTGLGLTEGIYSTIIGSNLGAIFTPLGALAGIMWMGILKNHNIKYNFIDFVRYGAIISIPCLIVALSSLLLFI